MGAFLLALTCFLLCHLVPAAPPMRRRLVESIGPMAYLLGYCALSLALLVWLIAAARAAPVIWLWEPRPWQRWVPVLLMPFSAILLVAGAASANPLSLSFRPGSRPGPIVSVTRHPLLWALLLWAASHVPPNGTLVAVILFGSLAAICVAGFSSLDRKARTRLGPRAWRELAADTSIWPFAAMLRGRRAPSLPFSSGLAVAAGLLLYAWFLLWGHIWLIGLDPLAGL
jgi:uncharacterized membrane protein